MNEKKSDLVKLCGLWENTDRNGNTYLSGNLAGARLMIFRRPPKASAGENAPDWNVFITERQNVEKPAANEGREEPL